MFTTRALFVAAILFAIGVAGVIVRRNAIVIFMAVELMLNAVNLTFVALAQQLGIGGQVFVFFVMAVAAAGSYGAHPIVRTFRLNTLFPFARAVSTNANEEWSVERLIEVAPRGWVESDGLDRKIVFDQERDIRGPVTVAVALERIKNQRTQRVVVVGGGHFLANTYLGNGGNLDLGINIVNWLMGDDVLIAIQPRSAPDVSLALTRGWLFVIVATFLIVVPLGCVVAGALIWWRRRRA